MQLKPDYNGELQKFFLVRTLKPKRQTQLCYIRNTYFVLYGHNKKIYYSLNLFYCFLSFARALFLVFCFGVVLFFQVFVAFSVGFCVCIGRERRNFWYS